MNLNDLEEAIRNIAEELELSVDEFEIPGGIDDANDRWQERVEESIQQWATKNSSMKPSSVSEGDWLKSLVNCDVVEDSGSYHMYRLMGGEDLPWENKISSMDTEKSLREIGLWFSTKLGKDYKKFQKQLRDAAFEGCKTTEEDEEDDKEDD